MNIEIKYLEGNNQSPSTADSSVIAYCKQMVKQEAVVYINMLIYASALVHDFLQKNLTVLTQYATNQSYTIETMAQWETYLDAKIAEQNVLNTRLMALSSTQSRESTFTLSDVQSLSSWKRGVNITLALLLTILVLIFVFRNIR